jgi:hypothetical protein
MSKPQNESTPFVHSVKAVRRRYGDMSNAEFWNEVRDGHFELLGSSRKRLVTHESVLAYDEHLRKLAELERATKKARKRLAASKTPAEQPTA